jgi:hypothetical protein
MLQSLDCPHCFTTVLVGPDGTCPHCKKSVNDLAGADSSLRKIWVKDGAKLPEYCIQCDNPSRRRIKLAPANAENPDTFGRAVLLGLNIGQAIRHLFKPKGICLVVHVELSQCEACSSREVKPYEVDFEHLRLSLLVDRRFAERIRLPSNV